MNEQDSKNMFDGKRRITQLQNISDKSQMTPLQIENKNEHNGQ